MHLDVNEILEGLEAELGSLPRDLHVKKDSGTYAVISGGKVIKMGEPIVTHCPLAQAISKYRVVATPEMLSREIERRIEEMGYFSPRRTAYQKKLAIPFGASEMIMVAMKKGFLDCAVVVCDGAGSVIATDPCVVQGIGAHMNGILHTTPYREVVERLEERGSSVPFARDGKIDQVEAAGVALKMGNRRIAVTVSHIDIARLKELRAMEKEAGARITLFAVCLTGITDKEAREINDTCDLVWACASAPVRKIAGPAALLQLGVVIPVFAVTMRGVEMIGSYSNDPEFLEKMDLPRRKYYVTSARGDGRGKESSVGIFGVYIHEADSLPVLSGKEPRPLV
ncbi:MAG: DUF2099 family protein [Candidatus Tritonobacter lacicola]|nr:DUF2099 family protein [Candidatus Tritonobacter lacicola]